jgi:hypothetical protein
VAGQVPERTHPVADTARDEAGERLPGVGLVQGRGRRLQGAFHAAHAQPPDQFLPVREAAVEDGELDAEAFGDGRHGGCGSEFGEHLAGGGQGRLLLARSGDRREAEIPRGGPR